MFSSSSKRIKLTLDVTYAVTDTNPKPQTETINIGCEQDLKLALEILQRHHASNSAILASMKVIIYGHRNGKYYQGEVIEGFDALLQFVNETGKRYAPS